MIKDMKMQNFISAWAEMQEFSAASGEGAVPISHFTFTPSVSQLDKLSYVITTFIRMFLLEKDLLAFSGIMRLISQRPLQVWKLAVFWSFN